MSSQQQFERQLNLVLNASQERYPLAEMLAQAATLESLEDLAAGTRVLVRLDLDVPVEDGRVQDPTRLQACAATVAFCCEREWTPILLGHLGRHGASLQPVSAALADVLGRDIFLLDDWLDEQAADLSASAKATLKRLPSGSIVMLENVRRYALEQALWDEGPAGELARTMFTAASNLSRSLSGVYVNDAVAASNRDFSSAVLPLAMERTALGIFIRQELAALAHAQRACGVVMGGVKPDKLDNLEAIVNRGFVELVIVAGALALPLCHALAELEGGSFSLGAAGTELAGAAQISPARLAQASQIVADCRRRGVRLVLPVDFVLDTGEHVESIPSERFQMDIGPATRQLFGEALARFAAEASGDGHRALFYNGVPGKFEDARFEAGTAELIASVVESAEAGVAVFVGGGDGRRAFARYGDLDRVAHAFSAGGTILKGLAGRPLPMVNAVCVQNAARGAGSEEPAGAAEALPAAADSIEAKILLDLASEAIPRQALGDAEVLAGSQR